MAVEDSAESRGTPGRRWVWIALVVAVALAGVCGWRAVTRGTTTGGAKAALVVGDQRGGLQALLTAAGELDDVPYRIDWALFPAASPLLEALGSGAVDVGGIGGAPFAFAYAGGAPIKVVFAMRAADGTGGHASAIIVKAGSPITSLAQLRGKRLATGRGSAGQNNALRLLEQAGLQSRDVTWVYLNNGEAKAALASGSIDAWSTWGSYVGIALLEDKERALADAVKLPAEAGFLAANDKAIATKRAQLADFLARAARARTWAQTHQEDYARVLSKETGIPLEVARFTVRETVMAVVPVDDGLRAEQQAILERYRRAGVIPSAPDLAGAFDPTFNPAVIGQPSRP